MGDHQSHHFEEQKRGCDRLFWAQKPAGVLYEAFFDHTLDNAALPDLADNLDFAAALPETGEYIVWVTGGSFATSYHLAVTIGERSQ